ncbi:hypothetical protein AB6870_01250 [Rahnella inusitata]|uniref:hypothetical protein n=1 Tax=Rahnella inusitata TaxID=58169 RepID=UPI0039BDDFA9
MEKYAKMGAQKKQGTQVLLPGEEFRFFNLEARQAGRSWNEVIYGEIADSYTLIQFTPKPVLGDNNRQSLLYEPHNLWKTLLHEDQKKKREKFLMEENGKRFSVNQRSTTGPSLLLDKKGYWPHKFEYSLSQEGRRALKVLLRDKKKIYSSLQSHYDTMVLKARDKKKKVILFPVSIFLDREAFALDRQEGSIYEGIKKQADLLNKQLPEVIKKLRHRAAYGIFLGYSKLFLLTDENFEPFLHIIFYLSEGDLSTWYAQDIASTWHKLSNKTVEVHYYSFAGELPDPPRHDSPGARIASKKDDGHSIVYKEVRNPFLSEDKHRRNRAISTARDLREQLQQLKMRENNGGSVRPADYTLLKRRLKIAESIKDTSKYHLNYLASVAKNYNNIPGLHVLTTSGFTYNSQYSNEKYRARKTRDALQKGPEVIGIDSGSPITDNPDFIDELLDNVKNHSSGFK